MKNKVVEKIKPFILLHLILLFYSLGSICSKCAATQDFLSFKFIIFYGLVIGILGIYAILWQQILKLLPLNVAFSNKSVTVIWAMIFGTVFFTKKSPLI